MKRKKNLLLLLLLMFCIRVYSQPGDSLNIPCGFDVSKCLPPATSTVNYIITPQAAFSPTAVFSCGNGHFNVYYEDMQQNIGDGFDHPSLGVVRRNTLCAVLNYMESVIDFGSVTIDLYVDLSFSAANQAPVGTTWAGQAGPIFMPGTFGSSPGFFGGNFYDHVTTGNDPDPTEFDATITINFDNTYVGTSPIPISYWDDYQNTTPSCKYDLYSLLLHELTHAMGWLSALGDDMSPNHYLVNKTNTLNIGSFSKLDEHFLYFGDPRAPWTFSGNKLVDNNLLVINSGLAAPAPNILVNMTNTTVTNSIWMTDQGAPNNYKAYDGYWYQNVGQSPPVTPAYGSFLSHMDNSTLALYRGGQYSPGYQPRYVMDPFLRLNRRRREWAIQELRMLLTMGYQLNPAFAGAANYLGGGGNNASLVLGNTPPVRIGTTTLVRFPLINTTDDNLMMTDPENKTAQYTFVNTNAPGAPAVPLLTIDTHTLGTDINGQPVGILPHSIYGIRGVTTGGNNHNCIAMTNSHTLVYTPPPGFHGRAEFGFRLWDGLEPGAELIITMDLLPGTFTLAPGNELLINGSFEDATEVKTPSHVNSATSTRLDGDVTILNYGVHQSGGHPYAGLRHGGGYYNYGIVRKDSYRYCHNVTNALNIPPLNPEGYGSELTSVDNLNFNNWSYVMPWPNSPANNECYFGLTNQWSVSGWAHVPVVSTLIRPLQTCRDYRFTFEMSGNSANSYTPGFPVRCTLLAVNNLTNTNGVLSWNVLQAVPLDFTLSTGIYTDANSSSWQKVVTDFVYCGPPTMTVLLAAPVQTNLSMPAYQFAIDNLSLIENTTPPPPLIVQAQNSSTLFCPGSSATLTALVTNSFCPVSYTWLPMNTNGHTVSVTPPNLNTSYTVLASDGCRTGSAVVYPVPLPAGSFTVPPVCLGQYSSTDLESQLPPGTPLNGTFFGTALSLSTTANGPRHFIDLTPLNGTFTAGSYSYTYQATLPNNCIQLYTASVVFVPTPTLMATSQCILAGTTVTLYPTPAVDAYTWTPVYLSTPSLVVSPTVTSGYELLFTYQGCKGTLGPIYVNVLPPVTFTNLPANGWCTDQTVTVLEDLLVPGVPQTGSWTASGGISIQTSSLGTTATIATSLIPGIYTVGYTYTAGTGTVCAMYNSFTVSVQPGFPLATTANTVYCSNIGAPAVISASSNASGITYSWQPGNLTGPVHSVTPSTSLIYTLTASGSVCQMSRTVSVGVNTACCQSQDYIAGGALGSSTLSGLYAVNSDLIITGDVSIDGEFLFSANTKVTVMPGAYLHANAQVYCTPCGGGTMNSKAHLRGCGAMWSGIEVMDGGKLEFAQGDLIEDAIVAVSSNSSTNLSFTQNQFDIILNNVIFNRNRVGVEIRQYNQNTLASPFQISGCLFTVNLRPSTYCAT